MKSALGLTFKVAVLAIVMFAGFALGAPLLGGGQRPAPEQASAVRALLGVCLLS